MPADSRAFLISDTARSDGWSLPFSIRVTIVRLMRALPLLLRPSK
jgi:hypothetical protein